MTSFPLSRRAFLASGLAAGGSVLATSQGFAMDSEASNASPPTTPAAALRRLQAGNRRFQRGKSSASRRTTVRRAETVEGQAPFAVVLGCADSRLPPELVFDQSIGELFTVRIAGNTAAASVVVGSVEYAIAVLKASLVVVLGHDDCGAVKAAIDSVTKGKTYPGELNAFIDPIVPAVRAVQNGGSAQLLQAATTENIRQTVAVLAGKLLLADSIAANKLRVIGAEYRLHSGQVDFLT